MTGPSYDFGHLKFTAPSQLFQNRIPISALCCFGNDFEHLKFTIPSQVFQNPVPIASICRFRDTGWILTVTNIDFWTLLHNRPLKGQQNDQIRMAPQAKNFPNLHGLLRFSLSRKQDKFPAEYSKLNNLAQGEDKI